jgi:hypothetical protein
MNPEIWDNLFARQLEIERRIFLLAEILEELGPRIAQAEQDLFKLPSPPDDEEEEEEPGTAGPPPACGGRARFKITWGCLWPTKQARLRIADDGGIDIVDITPPPVPYDWYPAAAGHYTWRVDHPIYGTETGAFDVVCGAFDELVEINWTPETFPAWVVVFAECVRSIIDSDHLDGTVDLTNSKGFSGTSPVEYLRMSIGTGPPTNFIAKFDVPWDLDDAVWTMGLHVVGPPGYADPLPTSYAAAIRCFVTISTVTDEIVAPYSWNLIGPVASPDRPDWVCGCCETPEHATLHGEDEVLGGFDMKITGGMKMPWEPNGWLGWKAYTPPGSGATRLVVYVLATCRYVDGSSVKWDVQKAAFNWPIGTPRPPANAIGSFILRSDLPDPIIPCVPDGTFTFDDQPYDPFYGFPPEYLRGGFHLTR